MDNICSVLLRASWLHPNTLMKKWGDGEGPCLLFYKQHTAKGTNPDHTIGPNPTSQHHCIHESGALWLFSTRCLLLMVLSSSRCKTRNSAEGPLRNTQTGSLSVLISEMLICKEEPVTLPHGEGVWCISPYAWSSLNLPNYPPITATHSHFHSQITWSEW